MNNNKGGKRSKNNKGKGKGSRKESGIGIKNIMEKKPSLW
jgi:hypothetical protein